MQPAQEEAYIPQIEVNAVGAISVIGENDPRKQPGHYRNIDGYREEDGRYAAFMQEISNFIPEQRQFTDPVRTFAYGTDASFYRLNPRLVVKVRVLFPGHNLQGIYRTTCLVTHLQHETGKPTPPEKTILRIRDLQCSALFQV